MEDEMGKKTTTQTIVLCQPATRWQDALPSGNGKIGAMVFGNIASDVVLVNHKQLWYPTEKPDPPDLASSLPEVRSMLAEGRHDEADALLRRRLKEQGYPMHVSLARDGNPYHPATPNIAPNHPAFDILIHQTIEGAFTDYRRSVSFDTGEVSVSWRAAESRFIRSLFVSGVDDLIVLRFTSSSAPISASLSLAEHQTESKSWLIGEDRSKKHQPPLSFRLKVEGSWLELVGTYDGGETFGGIAKVLQEGGSISSTDEGIGITGCRAALLLVKLFVHESPASSLRRLKQEIEDLPQNYTALLERHGRDHGEKFSRVSFDLRSAEDCSVDELLMDAYQGDVSSALVEKMYCYGRYLLLSSSRRGSWPAHLTGVWNGDYYPSFFCQYTNDTDLQECYWQALAGNLEEVLDPYFEYFESLLEDWRANARALFGCRGVCGNLYGTTHGIPNPVVLSEVTWPSAAGWLAQLFYDYWLFTGNRDFLKRRVVPLLSEIALFYEDFLTEDKDGKLRFSPSWSPENSPQGHRSRLAVNATMDVAVAREVLTNLLRACEVLGIRSADMTKWRNMLGKMPEYRINEDAALCEWIHPDLKDKYRHRHFSHIYPIFPGLEITAETSAELLEAGRIALEKRLQEGLGSFAGWSFPYLACCFARVGDGNRALECLELLLRSCTGSNLFTYHNDWRGQGIGMNFGLGTDCTFFSIDGNLGFTAAVQEMLLFSSPGLVSLLPALPDRWRTGKITGLRCRGGITVSIAWEDGSVEAALRADMGQEITLKCPGEIESISVDSDDATIRSSPLGGAYRKLRLPAEKSLVVSLELKSSNK
jgi:alpha-L-fucosidase 2